MITAKLVCVILALICFAFAFFGKPVLGVSWRDGGYFFVVLALFVF
jgi:hypothetical protein